MMAPDQDIELSDLNFTKLQAIIHKSTGISIADGRKSLLLSRLRRRLREVNAPDFKSYIGRVTSDADELQELINRVTTNKTYFYRTPRIWDHFRQVAVQEFLDRAPGRPMRIWSAAASTGEEAHTIGIVLEDTRLALDGFDYSILGSDVSSQVVKIAEAGVYETPAIARFRAAQPDLFRRYVTTDDDNRFRVDEKIRARTKFKLHNLQNRLKNVAPFDTVFLRNVLIYFTVEDQENILRNIHAQLAPGGMLYIGESETLSRLDTDFEIIEPMVYRPRAATGGQTT